MDGEWKWITSWKVWLIILMDWFLLAATGFLALLVRFDFSLTDIPGFYFHSWVCCCMLQMATAGILFPLRRMYHYIWHKVDIRDVVSMVASVFLNFAFSCCVCALFSLHLPASVWFLMLIFQVCALVGARLILRIWGVLSQSFHPARQEGPRIMLIGAGEAGRLLSKEIHSSGRVRGQLCCVIDDNPMLAGKYLDGVRIVGGRGCIPAAAEEFDIDQIIMAMPSAPQDERANILNICSLTGCRLRVLPGIYQLLNGEVSLSAVQDVQVEDLLGRTPIRLDTKAVSHSLAGKVVLVTGGGGSIGSELCRQIAKYHPKTLVILDIYENNAYDIQQELHRTYGAQLDLRVEIASIRDKDKMYRLFDRYRPQVVFHAAAHKHVPLMELCPEEAIKNNIFGTYHVVRAAEKYGVQKFVMISSDKAVNPTNLMGATKRFCEMILQSRVDSPTEFSSVRFGNVLGSNGSVVPLFQRQIQMGGPVTITDRRMIRYFMTIPEAAMLVLEAGAMAGQGQIFVLDMGEPVKILTLAENMIRLCGREPYTEIEIREIGLRPGEKLYEELLMQSETLSKTSNQKIFVEQQRSITPESILHALVMLDNTLSAPHTEQALIDLMRQLVPTYTPQQEQAHTPTTTSA